MSDESPASLIAAVVHWSVQGMADAASIDEIRWANAERIVRLLDAIALVADPPPRLIVLPVLAFTSSRGGVGIEPGATAIDGSSDLVRLLADACRRHDVLLVTSSVERRAEFPGRYFHSGLVISGEGLVMSAPKIGAPSSPHITLLRDFRDEWTAAYGDGALFPVLDTPFGRIGCLVESELIVPGAIEELVARGAEIIVHPSLSPTDSPHPYLAALQSAASRCAVFILSATIARVMNEGGVPGETWRGGRSCIVAPDGRVLASVEGDGVGFVFARLQLDELATERERAGRYSTAPRA